MAAIPADFPKSATVEDAFLELAELIDALENDTAKNPTAQDNMSISYGTNGSASISYDIPVTKTIAASGKVEVSATEYLL